MEVKTGSKKAEKTVRESIPVSPPVLEANSPAEGADSAPIEPTSRWDGLALKVWVICFLILAGCHAFELLRNLFAAR